MRYFFFRCRIFRNRNNRRWQLVCYRTGRVLMSSKAWIKALNYMIVEQKKEISRWGIHYVYTF